MRRLVVFLLVAAALAGLGGSAGEAAERGCTNNPVTTGAVSVGATSATLTGNLGTQCLLPWDYHFDYGTTIAYGSSTADVTVTVQPANLDVQATVTGLTPSTTYHYRLVNTEPYIADSADGTFTTAAGGTPTPPPPPPPPPKPTPPPLPTVASVSPSTGPNSGGTTVTIRGTHFDVGVLGVSFGDTPASSFAYASPTVVTATAPPEPDGMVDITVKTFGGTSATTSADTFTYAGPVITNVYPTNGPAAGGTTVFISGHGFGTAPVVRFGSSRAQAQITSDVFLMVTLPPGHGTVPLTVATPDGTAATSFSYWDYPTLTGLDPQQGRSAGGFTATITGENFGPDLVVHFGDRTITPQVLSPEKAQFTVPLEAGHQVVRVSVSGASPAPGPTGALDFAYEPPDCKGKCAFAWVSGAARSQSENITDGKPVGLQAPALEQTMPPGPASCSSLETCKRFGSKPVAIHLSPASYSGAAGSQASTDGTTGVLDASASEEGRDTDVPIDENFSGFVGEGSNASAAFAGGNRVALQPQPTSPVTVAVVVTVDVQTLADESAHNPGGTSAIADWEVDLPGLVKATGVETRSSAPGSSGYSTYVQILQSSAELGGRLLRGGATQTLIVPAVLSNPAAWSYVGYSFSAEGIASVQYCEQGNYLCRAEAKISVDPVVVPLTPGIRAVPLTPPSALHVPTVESASSISGRPGTLVRLSGARFGAAAGTVELRDGVSVRTLKARAWSDGSVTVLIPKAPAGTAWLTVKTASGEGANAFPFTITRAAGPLPVVTSIAPARGHAGTRIALRGVGLRDVRKVLFGTTPARLVRSRTGLVVVAPKGHGSVQVTVVTRVGTSLPTATAMFGYR